jgi:hypothetical protein
MKEDRVINIYTMLFNSINIALWILLAMFFNKWALSLFSLLFINLKSIKK